MVRTVCTRCVSRKLGATVFHPKRGTGDFSEGQRGAPHKFVGSYDARAPMLCRWRIISRRSVRRLRLRQKLTTTIHPRKEAAQIRNAKGRNAMASPHGPHYTSARSPQRASSIAVGRHYVHGAAKTELTYSATNCISRTGPALGTLIVCIIQVKSESWPDGDRALKQVVSSRGDACLVPVLDMMELLVDREERGV